MMNHISTGEGRISEPSTVVNTVNGFPQKKTECPQVPKLVVGWVNFHDSGGSSCWLVPRSTDRNTHMNS